MEDWGAVPVTGRPGSLWRGRGRSGAARPLELVPWRGCQQGGRARRRAGVAAEQCCGQRALGTAPRLPGLCGVGKRRR